MRTDEACCDRSAASRCPDFCRLVDFVVGSWGDWAESCHKRPSSGVSADSTWGYKHSLYFTSNWRQTLQNKLEWMYKTKKNMSQYIQLKSERAQSASRGWTSGLSLPLLSSSSFSSSHSSSCSLFLFADRKPTINVPTCCIWVQRCCNCSVRDSHFPLYLHFMSYSDDEIIADIISSSE